MTEGFWYVYVCMSAPVFICALFCARVYWCVCWSAPDREQGLRQPKRMGVWGVLGGKSVQDSFFLIWYRGRGGEAAVLFFLA